MLGHGEPRERERVNRGRDEDNFGQQVVYVINTTNIVITA